jgi:magnesium and cobalt transporter
MAESSHDSLPPDAGGDPERQSAERPIRGLRAWLRQLTRPRNGEEGGDTLEEMIEERQEVAEPIDPQEKMLIGNILKLHELSTADVMVQRVDIVALDVDTPFPEAVRQFVEQGHSRMPVYRETLDDVIGFVHVKDILGLTGEARRAPITPDMIRPLPVVPPDRVLADLLLAMRRNRQHIVLVAGPDGAPLGIITLDDVLSAVVGRPTPTHAAQER